MTTEKGKKISVRRVSLSAAQAARQLGVTVYRLSMLSAQGHLDSWGEEDNQRFGVESVLRLKAEDLLRGIRERAEDRCPEICTDVEQLAAIQFQRGDLSAQGQMMHDAGIPFRRETA
jgi:hypothetical protein